MPNMVLLGLHDRLCHFEHLNLKCGRKAFEPDRTFLSTAAKFLKKSKELERVMIKNG